MTINSRYDSRLDAGIVNYIKGKINRKDKVIITAMLRSVLQNNATYAAALKAVQASQLVGPAYIILGGTRPGEGAVVTKEDIPRPSVRLGGAAAEVTGDSPGAQFEATLAVHATVPKRDGPVSIRVAYTDKAGNAHDDAEQATEGGGAVTVRKRMGGKSSCGAGAGGPGDRPIRTRLQTGSSVFSACAHTRARRAARAK